MAERTKRRKLSDSIDDPNEKVDYCRSASMEEKGCWNGFCELESEPVCASLPMTTASFIMLTVKGAF